MPCILRLRPGPTGGLLFAAVLAAWLCLAPRTAVYGRSSVPQTEVRGRVADEAGDPLAGVTVLERGTQNGAVTLSDGRFSIRVGSGSVLEFSCLGYVPRRVEPGSSSARA